MKNIIPTILFLFIFCSSYAQLYTTKKFNSQELDTDRYLKVYIPPSYEIDSTKFYPITIVLDAEYLFDLYVGNSILFAQKDKAPEQIVVGINQNFFQERYIDCSYLEENSYPTDEGDAFFRFIKYEVLEYFHNNYRVSPFKTIVGNTLTANFINYFLLEEFSSFNAFITINPYFAMDIPLYLQQRTTSITNENIYYYLSGNGFNAENRSDLINSTNDILSSVASPKFKYKYDAFQNSTKTAAIGQSIPSALSFIFNLYSAISKEEFEANVKDLSPADAIAYLENKYVEIEYLFGSNLKMREQDIFAIESIVIDKENGDYLKNFGEMINKLYHESPIGDYYLGQYYEKGKNYKLALRYYKSGYMKLPKNDPNADGYYENIERVLQKRDGTFIENDENDNN